MIENCPLKLGSFYKIKYPDVELIVKPIIILHLRKNEFSVRMVGLRKEFGLRKVINGISKIETPILIHTTFSNRKIKEITEEQYNSECLLELL